MPTISPISLNMYSNGSGAYKSFPTLSPSVSVTGQSSASSAGSPTASTGGGTSGGNAALGWSMPSGFGHRKTLTISTDGTNNFGSAPAAKKVIDLGAYTNNQDITTGFDDFGQNPKAITDDHRDGVSMRVWLGDSDHVGQGIVNLASVTEIMATWSIKIPTGTRWPGASTTTDFGSSSSWKMVWCFLQDKNSHGGNGPIATGGNGTGFEGGSPVGQGNDNDLILLNWSGSTKFQLDGNNLASRAYLSPYPEIDPYVHFVWGERNTVTVWVRADPNNPTTGNAQFFFQLSNSNGTFEKFFNPLPVADYNPAPLPLFLGGAGTIHHWDYVNIVGYMGNQTGSTSVYDPRYQDMIIHSGANSNAFVQLGNASTYAACTCLVHCPITSWSTSSITVETRLGDLNGSNPVYAYITKAGTSLSRFSVGRIN